MAVGIIVGRIIKRNALDSSKDYLLAELIVLTVGTSYKLGSSCSSMAICEYHIGREQVTGSLDLIILNILDLMENFTD